MRLGCDLPYFADADDTCTFVQAAEQLGYDHIGFSEHVASAEDSPFPQPKPGPKFAFEDPWHESFTMLAYLAAVTSRIELSTAMTLLALRAPVLAAKQAAEVALLSGGRVRLGVSVGWNPKEYEALGVDPASRGARLEEQIVVMRRLWTEASVTYHGRFIDLDMVGVSPRPTRPVPVWMGAGSFETHGRPSDHALGRIARVADGYKMFAPLGGDRRAAVEVMAALRRHVIHIGRDPASVGIESRLITHVEPEAEWARTARFWEDAGATHLGLANRVANGGIDQQIDLLGRAMDVIGPELDRSSAPSASSALGSPYDADRDPVEVSH